MDILQISLLLLDIKPREKTRHMMNKSKKQSATVKNLIRGSSINKDARHVHTNTRLIMSVMKKLMKSTFGSHHINVRYNTSLWW